MDSSDHPTRAAHLETLFSALDQGYCLCEMIYDAAGRPVDYRFLETNALFEDMTGLRDARGRTAIELVPDLEYTWIETYAAVAAGEVRRFQSGSAAMGRWFDVSATPCAPAGCFVLVFRDVTIQHQLEQDRAAALATAERLLVELNHRVMNTLSLITSIVRMEAREVDADSDGGQAMNRLQTRLGAVSALYRALSNAAAVDSVRARGYLEQVVNAVGLSVGDTGRITVAAEIADVELPTAQAAPLGLLVNELMTNAVKYAFPDGRGGRLRVRLMPHDDGLRLIVQDDGVGMAPAREAGKPVRVGIGSGLIGAFAEQLGGHADRETSPQGTTVTVDFQPQPHHPIPPVEGADA